MDSSNLLIAVICEITDAKHESLPLPVNIVESWSLGSEIHQSSPGHLLREIARHATLWKVQVPAPGIEPGPKISQASALPTELQQLLCRMGQLLSYIEYSNWFSFLKDLKGVRCPAEVKVVCMSDLNWNFVHFPQKILFWLTHENPKDWKTPKDNSNTGGLAREDPKSPLTRSVGRERF